MNANALLILLFFSFIAPLTPQQVSLEEQLKPLFLAEHGTPDLKDRLRELGNDKEVGAILMQLVNSYRHAGERPLELKILRGAVVALGEIRLISANELLSSLLVDGEVHRIVRAQAAKSLGQIDPEGNKQILLNALNPSVSNYYEIRVSAAEGLAGTKDAEALKAIERYGREEKDSYVRQQFEKSAQVLREKGVKAN